MLPDGGIRKVGRKEEKEGRMEGGQKERKERRKKERDATFQKSPNDALASGLPRNKPQKFLPPAFAELLSVPQFPVT